MGLKLIVENDRNELSVHGFSSDIITIGRAPDNDLILPERNVSRHHFQIEVLDGHIIIEDRGSFNATYVNAKELTRKVEIFVGDVIAVGDYNIYLEQDEEDETMPQSRDAEARARTAETEILLAKSGPIGGRTFAVKGGETVIGSYAGADVYLFHPDIPPVYAKIIFDGNIYLLVPGVRDPRCPLVVNGMRVDSIDLRHGDEIQIGEFLFEYIEKGNIYDPTEYLLKAEEERRRKLREDLEKKNIKSIDDDGEVTEVTTQVEKTRQVNRRAGRLFLLFILLLAALFLLLVLLWLYGGLPEPLLSLMDRILSTGPHD